MRKIVIYICILIILGCAVYYIGEKTGHPVSELWEYAGEKISDHNILSGSVPADKRYESLKREYTFDRAMYPYLYMLSERGQKAYYIIYDGVSKCEKSIKLGDDIGVDRIEIMTVVTAVYNDHPDLFWMDSAARYTYEERSGIIVDISPEYNDLANNLSAAKTTFKANADQILSYAKKIGDNSVLAKEVYIHDCLCEICDYDESASNHQSAYSCLVEGRSVCSGYSRAFQYLMQQLGIPAYLVIGDINGGGPHAWNMVMINGNYYNVDVTWDDEVGRQIEEKCHAFFNVSDDDIKATHKRDNLSLNLERCPYNDMSYGKAVGYTISIDNIKMVPPSK